MWEASVWVRVRTCGFRSTVEREKSQALGGASWADTGAQGVVMGSRVLCQDRKRKSFEISFSKKTSKQRIFGSAFTPFTAHNFSPIKRLRPSLDPAMASSLAPGLARKVKKVRPPHSCMYSRSRPTAPTPSFPKAVTYPPWVTSSGQGFSVDSGFMVQGLGCVGFRV